MSRGRHEKLIILGSGPAGYTAAIYAARALLKPVLIQGIQPGGQMTITTDVENYPGFADVIQGPWLMEQMQRQAVSVGVELTSDHIVEVDLQRRPYWLRGDSGFVYTADCIIICTGAQAKWLGIPSEKRFKGFGVSACATCDGFFFKDRDVIVVGGGNTAAEEALLLANIARRVTLVHRRDQLKAERMLQRRLFSHNKIEVVWSTVLEEIVGADDQRCVTGVRLRNLKTGEFVDRSADGVFVAIGHAPATELFRGQLKMTAAGYIITSRTTATGVPGVFAAGDVTDDVYRQAVTAAGLGCMAALEADKYLDTLHDQNTEPKLDGLGSSEAL